MGFNISYNDEPELHVYAILFDYNDFAKAWNKNSQSFVEFSLDEQSDFSLFLTELENRTGFYLHTFEYELPATGDAQFYFIEVWQKTGENYDRVNDTLLGSQQFFWNGQTEIPPFSNAVPPLTSTDIWSHSDRSLTSSLDPSAKDIWEYVDRSLTKLELSESDKLYIKNTMEQSVVPILEDTKEIIDLINQMSISAEKAYAIIAIIAIAMEEIKTLVSSPVKSVNTQTPRITSSAPVQSNIRIG